LPILASGNDVEVLLKMSTNGNPLNVEYGSKKKQREARLDSWKEIATYLRRDVRTVQRWEQSEGLPVKRIFHRKASTVYAFTTELDLWLVSRGLPSQDFVQIADRTGGRMFSGGELVRRGARQGLSRFCTPEQSSRSANLSAARSGANLAKFQPICRAKGLPVKAKEPLQMSLFVACHPTCKRSRFGQFHGSLQWVFILKAVELPAFAISIGSERNGWNGAARRNAELNLSVGTSCGLSNSVLQKVKEGRKQ
jgi:hypothetical protein